MKQLANIFLIGLFAALLAAMISGWIVTHNPAPAAAINSIDSDLTVKFG